jgi:hypothetical protein
MQDCILQYRLADSGNSQVEVGFPAFDFGGSGRAGTGWMCAVRARTPGLWPSRTSAVETASTLMTHAVPRMRGVAGRRRDGDEGIGSAGDAVAAGIPGRGDIAGRAGVPATDSARAIAHVRERCGGRGTVARGGGTASRGASAVAPSRDTGGVSIANSVARIIAGRCRDGATPGLERHLMGGDPALPQ